MAQPDMPPLPPKPASPPLSEGTSSAVLATALVEATPPAEYPSMSSTGRPDDEFHKAGFANDIVVVKEMRGEERHLHFSDFEVVFDKKVRAGRGRSLYTVDSAVRIYVNGMLQPQFFLQVQPDGYCSFPDGSRQPPSRGVKALTLVPGVNSIRFEIKFQGDRRVLVAECFAFLMEKTDPMVVVDIDGTITKSDVPGLVMTLSPGTLDHTQPGICKLLNDVAEEGAQFLYLTSRPIVLAPKTRAFLMNLRQDGMLLPLGPLITCKSNVASVMYREIVSKDMHEYKEAALLEVSMPFRRAGLPTSTSVFAAGIGNRSTDAQAYLAAGIPKNFIFIIDTSSRIRGGRKRLLLRKGDQEDGSPATGDTATGSDDQAHHYDTYRDARFVAALRESLLQVESSRVDKDDGGRQHTGDRDNDREGGDEKATAAIVEEQLAVLQLPLPPDLLS
ncbi:unnamed protein product [Chrysoparadoxa australica]